MTIDMYIWEQEEPVKSILDYVHHLILHLQPEINHTIKWKVPYYSLNQALLYMNPLKKELGVEVCFARGRAMKNNVLLEFNKRKVVGGYKLKSLETINEEELQMLILNAIDCDYRLKHTSPWKPPSKNDMS